MRRLPDRELVENMTKMILESNNKQTSKLCPITLFNNFCKENCGIFVCAEEKKTHSKYIQEIYEAKCGIVIIHNKGGVNGNSRV